MGSHVLWLVGVQQAVLVSGRGKHSSRGRDCGRVDSHLMFVGAGTEDWREMEKAWHWLVDWENHRPR